MTGPRASEAAGAIVLSAEQERALRRRLRGWAHSKLGLRGEDFEDMYQAGWRVLLELQSTGPTHSVEHALRWAIEQRWRNELRRRARRPTVHLDTSDHPSLVAREETADRVELLEEARLLLEAAKSLTDRQWQILLLANICELGPGEISARLGISPRTYRRQRASALSAITAQVEKLSEGDWCEEHRELLAGHGRGQATSHEAQWVRWHVTNCLACRRELAAQRAARTGSRSRTPPERPPDQAADGGVCNQRDRHGLPGRGRFGKAR